MTAIASRQRRAIASMLIAVLMFSMMDALLKLLSEHYPPFQVATLRGLSSLPFVLTWALASVGLRALLRVRWPLHLLRGVLGVGMMAAFVYGVNRLPLSTTYSVFFIAPLLITALSGPILGERVGPRRWIAIGVGLLGVLVLLRPSGEGMLSTAALAVAAASLAYAVTAITVRVLSRTDSTQSMMVWLMVMISLGAGALAWSGWVPVRGEDWWLILGLGVAGSLGQYAITEAFRLGEASLIAPLEYTALIWGVILDLSLWGVLPDSITWVGAAIIVASGLYLLRRERVHAEAEHP
ncbi:MULTISPECIES: DMT family transporter [Lysobacter]|jgi:drug/metabolite transporter (DMT)-like permease|uniref:DMT family transporter n=2 Tax=Lysobacter gummosus TaxID=262324 RepID=A0ABY3XF95_9GAMM|nr:MULTISPECIES: DMT family transporter [Lysobacter]ALN89684.1 eamA-like transporter family protein [Lysobacter gummosus]UJB18410.1 DMT family transporter [Lysobacter capsici]UJQ27866.1 DMT family transporter [Lysobacter gummosus]UNP30307.1 DMT family transporter [Lysobacter gummosus]